MDAWLSVLRAVLVWFLSQMASKGLITADDSNLLVASIVNATPYIGAVAMALWGVYTHLRGSKIAAAANLEEVAVIVKPSEKMDHQDNPGVISQPMVVNVPGALQTAMAATK